MHAPSDGNHSDAVTLNEQGSNDGQESRESFGAVHLREPLI